VKKKAIVSAEVTQGHAHDSPLLKKLLKPIKSLRDVCCDSAYLSRKNCEAIADKGGTPFIKLKKGIRKRCAGVKAWRDMILFNENHPDEWNKRYHKRSIAESVFSAMKRVLRGYLTSLKRCLQRKELWLKVITYDLMVL